MLNNRKKKGYLKVMNSCVVVGKILKPVGWKEGVYEILLECNRPFLILMCFQSMCGKDWLNNVKKSARQEIYLQFEEDWKESAKWKERKKNIFQESLQRKLRF